MKTMNWKTVFLELDISAPAFVAGIAGGSVMLLKYRGISLRRALALVAGSAVASGYLTGLIVHGVGLPNSFIGAMGFTVGMSFMMALDVFVSLSKYVARNPKAVFELLVSLVPFRRGKKEVFIEDEQEQKSRDENDPA